MSTAWDAQQLLQPVTAEQPCGQDLEDTQLLASFDTFRLFGQSTPLDTPPEPGETRIAKPADSPEWAKIRDQALDALGKSKDFRLLAHLSAALLRTDGIPAFCDTLKVASEWLNAYWTQAYPLVDGDGMLRRNVLNCFADQMAVIDALRRLPLVTSRQHGRFTLRDIEIASGQAAAGSDEPRPEEANINAAFAEMPLEGLQALRQSVAAGLASLKQIGAAMGEGAGPDAVPSFDPLATQLAKIERLLRTHLAVRQSATAGNGSDDSDQAQALPSNLKATAPGAITSRQDAIRALDAVAEFFRRNEPSSPIPLLVDRAKRLVSKDFLEVLADVAPEALGQARAAGGLRQTE